MRVFVNILLIFILVVTTPVLLLVTSVKTNVLNTTFLKHELEQRDIYSVAFTVINEQIDEIELSPEIPITQEDVSTLVNTVLTPEWLQGNIEGVLDGVNTWLNASEDTELSIIISMAEPKANLLTELNALLERKLAELEPCSPDASEGQSMFCQFAGLSLDDLKQELEKYNFNLEDIINRVPDDLDLAESDLTAIFEESKEDNEENTEVKTEGTIEQQPEEQKLDVEAMINEIRGQLEQIRDYYQLGLRSFWYAWIIYGVLLALFIILNATGGWHRLVRWTGVLLLCIGLLPAVIGIGSSITHEFIMGQIEFSPDFPAVVKDVVPKLINDVQQAIFTLPLVAGIVSVVLGLAGIIGARWIPKPKGADKSDKKDNKKTPAKDTSSNNS